MNFSQTITGQQTKWELAEKLGEGDAGEVFRVHSLLEARPAILKRPRRSAFTSDTLRQASQILAEANILRSLAQIPLSTPELHIHTPQVLDQSPAESGLSERVFIIIEPAAGLDLQQLRQIAHSGAAPAAIAPGTARFAAEIAASAQLPAPLLTRILLGALSLLETIHQREIWRDRNRFGGILWNDVKPEHLFWDPARPGLTVIDWGNSQFLEPDGATRDRQFSRSDDDSQFITALGGFLAEANPGLHAELQWPADLPFGQGLGEIKERLAALHETHNTQRRALRLQEADLYAAPRPGIAHFEQCEAIHRQLAAHGELPDLPGALNVHARAALLAAAEADLETFRQVCQRAARLPGSASGKWDLLCEIADLGEAEAARQGEPARQVFAQALAAGVADDWPTLLWELFSHIGPAALPEWWGAISLRAQQIHLGLAADSIPPFTTLSRLYFTLQAALQQKAAQLLRAAPLPGEAPFHLQSAEEVLRAFNEEVIKKWRELEPAPPNAGVAYGDVDSLAASLDVLLPDTQARLEKALAQAKAQAAIVLSAWERKDFELARRGLRNLLLCDPDRRRLLTAAAAMSAANAWLARLRKGAAKNEPFYDYLTSVELAGRKLRSQVGPATWLDAILDALKRLRKGARSVDLLMALPEILNEIPWLNETSSREVLSLPRARPLTLERDLTPPRLARTIQGVAEARLGSGGEVALGEALDAWLPEARGSSARVFAGQMSTFAGTSVNLAVKLMRPDRVEYALPLFREEIQVLTLLRDVPGITPLVECGFLQLAEGQSLPAEETHGAASHLSGSVIRYGMEEAQNFLAAIERRLANGWIPYLALPNRSSELNLLRYCDAGHTHGWFLPLKEGLMLGAQICDILQAAHDRNIVYRDHKILHYYWEPETHGVAMIDWNIAKRQPLGLSDNEKQADLVQFGARALHHILTGRPAQGSLALGPNRPEDIERASSQYPVNWTYDDERLPNRVKEILERALNQGYTQARELRKDIADVYQQLAAAQPVSQG